MSEIYSLLRRNPRAVSVKYNISIPVNDLHHVLIGSIRTDKQLRLASRSSINLCHLEPIISICLDFIENHVESKESWNSIGYEDLVSTMEDYLIPEQVFCRGVNGIVKYRHMTEEDLSYLGLVTPPVIELIDMLIMKFDNILASLDYWMRNYKTFKHVVVCDYPSLYIVRLDDYRVYEYEKIIKERELNGNRD